MISHTTIILMLIAATAVSALAQTQPAATDSPDRNQINRTELARQSEMAIQRAVKFLISRQNSDGSWDANPNHQAGATALATLALLASGESHQSPPLDRAIKYLKRAQPQRSSHATYSVALRACVYGMLPEPLRKEELRADLRWLQQAVIDTGDNKGMYGYTLQYQRGDYSNSQYGVLGVWYAAHAGLVVPKTYWQQVENGWRIGHNEDGGWSYWPDGRASISSMTAAAAATLFITNDYLHANEAEDLNKLYINKPLDDALAWLGTNFSVERNIGYDRWLRGIRSRGRSRPDEGLRELLGELSESDSWIHYMLFGFERVGEASGLTRFGEHKWFDEGAQFLVRTQIYDGSWKGTINSEADTAYALLFLSRGRAPVVVQKLQFDGRWNNRPRDAAAFTQFMRRATERHVNWQIVSIDATPEELRESPILYLVSDRPLNFTDEQQAKIKAYIDQGGLLVCVNEGKANDFVNSVTEMAGKMYPAHQFRDLPVNHPAYTTNFPMSGNEAIRGLSNGLRELIVLYPTDDMSWKWHSAGGAFVPRKTPYASLANLWLYATDRANPRFKGEDTWVSRNEAVTATRSANIARFRYDGNWNPEPGGWERLSNIMHNFDQVDLSIEPFTPGQTAATRPDTTQYQLVHLTGTRSINLPAGMKAALHRLSDSGALLLLDAAGGSPETVGSLDPLLREIYPTCTIAPLPLDHPIYHAVSMGGSEIKSVTYRRSPDRADLQSVRIPRLRGVTMNGRLIAIVSYEDLSGGLVGYQTAGLTGYAPASAMDLLRNIILWQISRPK